MSSCDSGCDHQMAEKLSSYFRQTGVWPELGSNCLKLCPKPWILSLCQRRLSQSVLENSKYIEAREEFTRKILLNWQWLNSSTGWFKNSDYYNTLHYTFICYI